MIEKSTPKQNIPAPKKEDREISGEKKPEDLDNILRPQSLSNFTGQKKLIANLEILIAAAKQRDCLLYTSPSPRDA